MTEWILILVFHGSLTTVPGAFANEEECRTSGRAWVKINKEVPDKVNYACLPANFVNVK